MNSPEITYFASPFTREFPVNGFHNEIVTSAVRSGVWGLMSSLLFLLLPIYFVYHQLKIDVEQEGSRNIYLFILLLSAHLIFTGMSTEVMNLAFLASFAGLSFVVLYGEILYIRNSKIK